MLPPIWRSMKKKQNLSEALNNSKRPKHQWVHVCFEYSGFFIRTSGLAHLSKAFVAIRNWAWCGFLENFEMHFLKHLMLSQPLQAFSFTREDRWEVLPSVRIASSWQPASQLRSQKLSGLIATSSEELFGPLLNLFITWLGVMTLTSCTRSL